MFKLPGKPSPKADPSEIADFMELICWIRGRTSRTDMMRLLGIMDDNLDVDGEGYEGCKDADEVNGDLVNQSLDEIEYRQESCNGGYPFDLDHTGTILKVRSDMDQFDPAIIYFYLLSATRLNMKKEKKQADIDGALAMESVSAYALSAYLGHRSKSQVFGTSSGGSFEERINRLCKALKEPTSFSNIDDDRVPVRAQDDKLDVVAWLPFSNCTPGQLIVFAQSKTGTSWRDSTSELSPDVFQNKWLSKRFLVPPIRAFCVSESIIRAKWNSTCTETGLLLDRCRLVECCNTLEDEFKTTIRHWVLGAKKTIEGQLGG